MSPNLVFHHHDESHISYHAATLCEKNVYFGESNKDCGHKTHIAKSIKKCSLCEHHTSILFTLGRVSFYFFNPFYKIRFDEIGTSVLSRLLSIFFNKGPPSACFFN